MQELKRAMGAEMQDGFDSKIFAKVAIKRLS